MAQSSPRQKFIVSLKDADHVIRRRGRGLALAAAIFQHESRPVARMQFEFGDGCAICSLSGISARNRSTILSGSLADEEHCCSFAFRPDARPTVIKTRLADHAHRDVAANAFDPAHQVVRMTQPCNRHEIRDLG